MFDLLPYKEEDVEAQISDVIDIVNVRTAWEQGWTGNGIKVAVLDTGIFSSHPDLNGKVIEKINLTDGDIEDSAVGHGTHVAGIITQIVPNAKLINVKVLDDAGNGNFSTIMLGIDKAVKSGANVINMSLGGYYDCITDHPLLTLIRNYTNQGIIFCIASGNGGVNNPAFPGLSPDCISVGATDKADMVAYFSSTGPVCNRIFPDTSAPGVAIYSTWNDGTYKVLSGTSMATPVVSGMMAILRQKGNMTREEIEEILKNSCKDLGSTGKDNSYGWGRINIGKALEYKKKEIPIEAGINLFPFLLAFGGAALIGYLKRKKIR